MNTLASCRQRGRLKDRARRREKKNDLILQRKLKMEGFSVIFIFFCWFCFVECNPETNSDMHLE